MKLNSIFTQILYKYSNIKMPVSCCQPFFMKPPRWLKHCLIWYCHDELLAFLSSSVDEEANQWWWYNSNVFHTLLLSQGIFQHSLCHCGKVSQKYLVAVTSIITSYFMASTLLILSQQSLDSYEKFWSGFFFLYMSRICFRFWW